VLKGISLLLAGILLSSITVAQIDVAFAEKNTPDKYAPDRLLVKFKKDVSENKKKDILAKNEASEIAEISQIGVKILKVPEHALEKVESAFRNNDAVEFVEKDFLLEPTAIPNDPDFSNQWYLTTIKAPEAWDITTGISSIPIAILDTGVDPTHPDLQGKLISGYNFYDNNNDWSDVFGHGTKVAGTAAAITNNGIGVAGVAQNNQIIPIRITNTEGWARYSAMSEGIIYAADQGAKAANLSFQIYNGDTLTSAAKYMYDKGGWVVASGGNTGVYENYSDNPYIISVGATDSSDEITYFSSQGPYVDFVAPGSSIYTTKMGGTYDYTAGTSFSSPITAGVIALLFSNNPSMSPDQVYDALKNSSVDLGAPGRDDSYGWGRIDAYGALGGSTPPTVSIDDVSIAEGNSGLTAFTFTATRSDNTDAISVDFAIADDTATTADNDYQVAGGTVVFAAGGLLSKAIPVQVSGDTKVELDETFFVNLSNCVGCAILDNQGQGIIQNDDAAALPTVSIDDVSIAEGNSGLTIFTFTVTRSDNTDAISVDLATADGTATTADNDYPANGGTLNFQAGGLLSKAIPVKVNGDTKVEPDETFFIDLSNCVGCTIIDNQGQGTIQNDDAAATPSSIDTISPTVTITSPSYVIHFM